MAYLGHDIISENGNKMRRRSGTAGIILQELSHLFCLSAYTGKNMTRAGRLVFVQKAVKDYS
jgi:hypothetical protein